MTKLKEEKELQAITQEYENALRIFHKKSFKKAHEAFTEIIEKYANSESYNVMEIQARSKVYLNISNSHLNPVKIEPRGDDDLLWEGAYQLNAGNYEPALKHFQKIKKSDAYLDYLKAVTYFKMDDIENALDLISKCIKKDEFYKVIVYNEPDFESLHQNSEFCKIVE